MNKIADKINTVIDSIKDLGRELKIGFNKFINIFKQIKWLDIPATTYVRWVLAFIVCLNTVLNHLGINPISISENTLYQIISAILSVCVLIVNTYKNNSTSKEALLSDKIMHALKDANTNDEDEMIARLETILIELKGEDEIPPQDHSNFEKQNPLEPLIGSEELVENNDNTVNEESLIIELPIPDNKSNEEEYSEVDESEENI
jgi:SPP1 family holin